MAFFFCLTNGWLQGSYLFTAPSSLPSPAEDAQWLSSWQTRLGIGMFFVGWAGNQHADWILRHLRDKPKTTATATAGKSAAQDSGAKARKDGSESAPSPSSPQSRYRIPHGGLFHYVSAANYSAEIFEWMGFALAASAASSGPSHPAIAFLLFTIMNLAPRGISAHRWYQRTFTEYPKGRKAIIPFVL